MKTCNSSSKESSARAYWRRPLILGGALFLAAGVIFFIAANWSAMHRFGRMALVGIIVAGTGLGAARRGPDTHSGKVLLLTCGVCVGPLLAVFGQTYQTGAELWELFRVWIFVLLALAAVGRQAALWFAAWLAANVFVMLWLGGAMEEPLMALGMFSLLPECVLALALAVAAWEYAAARNRAGGRQDWLRSRWLPRLLFFDLTARLTAHLCLSIFFSYGFRHPAAFVLPHEILPVLALAVACGSWRWHRKHMPDLFMPACLVGAGAVLLAAVLLRLEFLFEAGVASIFIWGVLITGLTAGVARILVALSHSMERDQGQEKEKAGPSPWYVRAMLALGGWAASLLFLLFLGFFLFDTLRVRDGEGAALFGASLVPLGIAFVCLKRPGNLTRHFGLSLALAGSAAACIGLSMFCDSWRVTPLLAAVVLAGLCAALSSPAYRFIAALVIVQLVATGILVQSLDFNHADRIPSGDGSALRVLALCMAAAWWAAVSVGLAGLRLRERDWRGPPCAKALDPIFFGAYGGMMVCLVLALSSQSAGMVWDMAGDDAGGFLVAESRAVGLGAAVGLLFLTQRLIRAKNGNKGTATGRGGILACAALCVPLGWHLPGVGLAAFGLALSRHCGNLVMQGVTGAFLFAYMIHYYSFLGIPLTHKSLLLAGTGAALLGLAHALERLAGSRKEGGTHA